MGSDATYLVPLKEEEIWIYKESVVVLAQRKALVWGHREKVAICKPMKEASGETGPLILDLQFLEL